MSSEKHPKPELEEEIVNLEDVAGVEIDERDLFATWEPPAWETLQAESSAAVDPDEEVTRVAPPPLPPSLPPSLPELVLPPLEDEVGSHAEAGLAPLMSVSAATSKATKDVSSLAPTVREQPAPAAVPARRGSARPLIAGAAAFACAAALWFGMPHPEADEVLAPHAATASGIAPALRGAATANVAPVAAPAISTHAAAVADVAVAAPDSIAAANDATNGAGVAADSAPARANEIVVPAVTIDRAPAPAPAPAGHARGGARRSKRVVSTSGPLPDAPRREDVIGALNQLRGQLKTCSAGRSGVAEIDLTIAGNGAVSNALISGDFAGTPQGSCLARAIRTARFAPFAQPRSRILYRMAL